MEEVKEEGKKEEKKPGSSLRDAYDWLESVAFSDMISGTAQIMKSSPLRGSISKPICSSDSACIRSTSASVPPGENGTGDRSVWLMSGSVCA